MALNNAGKNAAATGVTSSAGFVSLHSGDPGTTGTNETTAGRQAATWQGTNGSRDLVSALNFTGGAASGACTHAGLWSASTGGTFLGGAALTGDQTFNAAGEYTLNEFTVTAT